MGKCAQQNLSRKSAAHCLDSRIFQEEWKEGTSSLTVLCKWTYDLYPPLKFQIYCILHPIGQLKFHIVLPMIVGWDSFVRVCVCVCWRQRGDLKPQILLCPCSLQRSFILDIHRLSLYVHIYTNITQNLFYKGSTNTAIHSFLWWLDVTKNNSKSFCASRNGPWESHTFPKPYLISGILYQVKEN